MNRREMLGTMGAAAAGLAATQQAMGGGMTGASGGKHDGQDEHVMLAAASYNPKKGEYVLPPLPYAYDALEPSIDEQTMRLHHDKHHAGYVRGLNKALSELAKARKTGDWSLVQYWTKKVSFNGGGHTLHSIFWQNMAPARKGGGGEPSGKLKDLIEQSFGSVDAMREQFSAAAGAVEGGGWGMLGHETMSGRLIVLQAENQQKLTTWGVTPVLVLDVWEHAYYLKYQNRRGDYIKAWWDVVNWKDVAQRVNWHTG